MLYPHRYTVPGCGEEYSTNNIEPDHHGLPYDRPDGDSIKFPPYCRKTKSNHFRLTSDLQICLERDELNIHYQPLIDLNTGRTFRVEALVRWHHQISGSIPPDIFIPLAEQTSYIHNLTFWVLDRALGQLHAWEADGIDIDVAVNLSMSNLHYQKFPLQVAFLLDKWSIAPARLNLEITEGVIMRDPEQAISTLDRLNDLGARLALDDFGTGFSSLSHLARLPITELKIDRSLIMNIDKNSKNAMIVRSTIELAKKLGLQIVAEGVENAVIYNILKEYGCTAVQGYFISKPVNGIEFKSWFAATSSVTCN